MQADIVKEQARRFSHVAAVVANPLGEVAIKGEVKQHKACRRMAHFETLYASKVFDRSVFAVLEWYADRLALASSGMFKSALAVGGGGGSAFAHVPATAAATEARSDVDWARAFIPADLRPAFDGVMADGDTFEAIGARIYANVSPERARKKASSAFKIAANHLLLGCGHLVQTGWQG